MFNLLKTQLGRLRVLAFVEGVSFLVILFITMPLKYAFSQPQPNKVFGMVHGFLFIMYVLAVVQIKIEQNWPIKKTGLALLASVIPFGTFWADAKLFRQ
jgi:integral membrane protein